MTPVQIVLDAGGKYAWAPCQRSDDIQQLTIDATSGSLLANGSRFAIPKGLAGAGTADCLGLH